MIWFLFGFFVITATGSAIYLYTRSDSSKSHEILKEIGILKSSNDVNVTPFYKWSWKQESEDRVSAERMIKQSFENVQVWMDEDDLAYFKDQCTRNQSGAKIDETDIFQRVESIVNRTELLHQEVKKQIETTLQSMLHLSENEARESLQHAGILAEQGKALQQYCSLELRRLLNRLGANVLAHGKGGISLHDATTGQIHQMRGLGVWQQCLLAAREEFDKYVATKHFSAHPPLYQAIKSSLKRGFMKDFETDLTQARLFRTTMEDMISEKKLNLSIHDVDVCDQYCYGWKFTKGIPFKQVDHNRFRDLLTHPHVPPYVSQILIQQVGKSFDSLKEVISRFPRNVIFYGSQEKARSFAMTQYGNMVHALFQSMAITVGQNPEPPIFLWIPSKEIDPVRGSNQAKLPPKKSYSFPHDSSEKKPSLAKILTKHQRLNTLEQQIKKDDADLRGWLIDVPIPDQNPEEFLDLECSSFKSFSYFFCDTSNTHIFDSKDGSMQKKRDQYVKRMVDSLLNLHPVKKTTMPLAADPVAELQ